MKLFYIINDLADKNIFLDSFMIMLSKYVPIVFMSVLVLIFILGIVKNKGEYRKVAFNTFIFTIFNLILSFIIGSIYFENRPFVQSKVNLLYPHAENASFPSDHVTGTMSIALGMKAYNNILSKILTMLSILVGISRVYVGHHYPMDVIGAYVMVVITGYLYNLFLKNKIDMIYDRVEKTLIIKLGFSS
ncbi:undecaprenyl-diphosphatase [Clostridium tetanomorphum]|nr:undecaprenyl-diphosphatase [Clostridium tetanomorphum]